MPGKLTLLVTRNWPIKLTALLLSVLLYFAVALKQPITQTFALQVAVRLPPGRTLREKLPQASVVLSGRGSELLKLRTFERVLTLSVPDTFSGSHWTLHLQPGDVEVPKGADVVVTDVTPHDIDVALDSVSRKTVRVVPLITVVPDSGYVLRGGLTITPSQAVVVGPEQNIARVESVTTTPTQITDVNGPFTRAVAIDTGALGVVRVGPKEVQVSGELATVGRRDFTVAVETGAGGGTLAGLTFNPAHVTVTIEGPTELLQNVTRDSVKVIAHAVGAAQNGGWARLTVLAPRGLAAKVAPDSVALRKRS